MLHAVLHNKLDETIPEPQRLEDALTSTVFGTLAITDACEVLTAWLSRAKRVDGTREQIQAQRIDGIWFWPRLSLAEPDLVLQLGDMLFIIEAKYRSGRHDLASLDGDTNDGQSQITDQLHRQWLSLCAEATDHAGYPDDLKRAIATCQKSLIYLVDGRRSHRAWHQFRESIDKLPSDADCRLLTWQSLHEVIASSGLPIRSHHWQQLLCDYLGRLGLEGFIGLRSHSLGQPSEFTAATCWLAGLPTYAELGLHSVVHKQPGAFAAARHWMVNTASINQLDFAGAVQLIKAKGLSILFASLAFSPTSSGTSFNLYSADIRNQRAHIADGFRAVTVWINNLRKEDHNE